MKSQKKNRKQRKNKRESPLIKRELKGLDHIFLLHLKASLRVIIVWIASLILHNVISQMLGFEEAFFFILAVIIIPAYLLISVVYTLIRHKEWEKEIKELAVL